jgi:hypothetical protein
VSGIDAIDAALSFFDEDWRKPVRAATKRKGSVFVCIPEVGRD